MWRSISDLKILFIILSGKFNTFFVLFCFSLMVSFFSVEKNIKRMNIWYPFFQWNALFCLSSCAITVGVKNYLNDYSKDNPLIQILKLLFTWKHSNAKIVGKKRYFFFIYIFCFIFSVLITICFGGILFKISKCPRRCKDRVIYEKSINLIDF